MKSNRSHVDWIWQHEPRDWEWRRDPPDIKATLPATTYNSWRFYQDNNADPDSCTALAALDSSYTIAPATPFMYRGLVDETAGKNYLSRLSFQYNKNGAGWNNITGSSSNIQVTAGTPADDAVCNSQILTAPGSGTFTNGEYDESVGATGLLTVAKDDYTEVQACLTIVNADVADGDKIYLRVITPDVAAYTDSGGNESRIGVTKSTTDPLWDQDSFRVGNDDGSESAYNFKRAVNTNWTQRVDSRFLMRFLVQETAGASESPTLTLQLQYNKNSGGWNNVTGASSNVRAEASANLTEGGDTTQRIGAGTFLTNNNWVDDNDGLTAASGAFAGNDEAEALFSIFVRSADVADDDTIQLRVIESPATALDSYTNTPTLTVTKQTEEPKDSLTLTENLVRTGAYTRDMSDALTLTENPVRTGVWTREMSDSIPLGTEKLFVGTTALEIVGHVFRRLFWR